jgi:Outer membrane protein beta-barrel domain
MNTFLKFIAVAGCIVWSQSGFAQFSKGAVLVGGSLSFSNYSSNTGSTNNETRLGFSPIVGYVFKDNWSSFLELGYSFSDNTGTTTYGYSPSVLSYVSTKQNNFYTSIGVERLLVLGDNFGFALRGNIGVNPYNQVRREEDGNKVFLRETTENNLVLNIGVSPALTYQIGKRFNLRLSGGYLGFSYNDNNRTVKYPSSPDETIKYTIFNAFSNLSFSNLSFSGLYLIQPKAQKTE